MKNFSDVIQDKTKFFHLSELYINGEHVHDEPVTDFFTLIQAISELCQLKATQNEKNNKKCRRILSILCETATEPQNATSQPSRPLFAIFHLCVVNKMLLLADFTQIAAEPNK